VAKITAASQCTSSNLPSSRFEFVISQSSPSKGSIGINRMVAADYLAGSSTMRTGLVAHAQKACEKKFGVSKPLANKNVTILRHKGTAACKAPELAIE